MKGKTCFCIQLPYQKTLYAQLCKLAIGHTWNKYCGKYQYIFEMENLEPVEKLLGNPIELEGRQFEREKVYVPEFKGMDFPEIIEFPLIYQIIEHRKDDDGKVQEHKHEIPKALVDDIYKHIVAYMPLNKPMRTSVFCEKICSLWALDRFKRDTGTFDFAKFFGNRKDYYTYFYLPVKVLVFKGKIKHHKKGKIERLN
jgi:hypothetical protein